MQKKYAWVCVCGVVTLGVWVGWLWLCWLVVHVQKEKKEIRVVKDRIYKGGSSRQRA